MKLEPMTDKKHRQRRAPLASFEELAAGIGKTSAELRGIFARASDAPKPVRRFSNDTTSISYYDPTEFRAWWSRRAEAC